MSLNDPLAAVLSQLDNAAKVGKKQIITVYTSSLIKRVLEIMKTAGYIGEFEETTDAKGNYLTVTLTGGLNKCGVVKPRFAVGANGYERFEKQFLPARGFGFLIISTNKGLLTHDQAKEQHVGGKLISYCY